MIRGTGEVGGKPSGEVVIDPGVTFRPAPRGLREKYSGSGIWQSAGVGAGVGAGWLIWRRVGIEGDILGHIGGARRKR